MTVSSYRDLIVWQKSYELVKEVYLLTSRLPKSESFGLISQIQRCAVSIPSNITEGQQRNNIKEYKQFLGITRGSAAELSTQLLLVNDIYNVKDQKCITKLEEIQKMLYGLIQKL